MSSLVSREPDSRLSSYCRKEKSLGVDLILLENAAKALPGDADDATVLRTKVRRLYDIANVLSSMNLIEKIRHPDSGKPAYRWLGWRGKANDKTGAASDVNEPRKRGFGTDITNHGNKRKREVTEVDCKSSLERSGQMHDRLIEPEHESDSEEVKEYSKHLSKGIEFGPFAPISVAKVEDAANKRARQVGDWETLASTYRPQYRNQALCDLFAHYMEAWKTWFVDAVGKQQMQQIF
ncbi:hypothetical protein TIFTF001_011634 [Ficus carica]|uniref:E2F/DP family winged-helix DNA-binding domain-containing protein n=1 Tax=Ficus carica TaxID=3494 RepID=A0AA87ZZ01_FICCA|nr:hypothetical protein TIFTF001_011634 [Ficus carica]